MQRQQRGQNPDVNSTGFEDNYGSREGSGSQWPRGGGDVETPENTDVIPVPPDAEPAVPIEEPPETERPPVGDVKDSPKKIAGG
jgi:hypothetical protein